MKLPSVFRLLRWVHVYEKEGSIAIFHALNIKTVFLDSRLMPLVNKLKYGTTLAHLTICNSDISSQIPPVIDELYDQGFLISVDGDDEAEFEKIRRNYALPPGIETLYLLLSDACNLRCSYCFILDGMPEGYHHSSMSKDVAFKAVDTFFKGISENSSHYDNSRKVINFYGGEPLINYPVIKSVIEYVETTYKNELSDTNSEFVFSIITNGTLIDKQIAEYFSSNKRIAVTVSLDGVEWINDKKRIYKDGKGSFCDVIRGLQLLKNAGCENISLSCTIDSHNIDYLDDLLELHDDFNFASINLNPLLDTEAGLVDVVYTEKVNKKIIAYFQKAREKGVYEDRMIRKVRPFISGKIHSHDCQATGHQIVCSPDGKLGVCQEGIGEKNYFFSDLTPDFSFHSDPTIAEWNSRTPLNMPQCRNCPAIGICGGGCAYGAQIRNGSIWSVDDRFCVHSLTTLEWLIWDLHRNTAFSPEK